MAKGIENDSEVHAALLLYKAKALRGLSVLLSNWSGSRSVSRGCFTHRSSATFTFAHRRNELGIMNTEKSYILRSEHDQEANPECDGAPES